MIAKGAVVCAEAQLTGDVTIGTRHTFQTILPQVHTHTPHTHTPPHPMHTHTTQITPHTRTHTHTHHQPHHTTPHTHTHTHTGTQTVVHPSAKILAEGGPIIIGEGNLIQEEVTIINR